MKLLLDQNLSRRLVDRLSGLYSEICHVTAFGLEIASDEIIWDFALSNGHAILTEDSDFSDLSSLRGSPLKGDLVKAGELHHGRSRDGSPFRFPCD